MSRLPSCNLSLTPCKTCNLEFLSLSTLQTSVSPPVSGEEEVSSSEGHWWGGRGGPRRHSRGREQLRTG